MDSWFPTFRRLLGTRVSPPFIWLWFTTASQRRGLLRLIAVGIEEKLPLAPLLAAWSADQRGVQRYRVLRVVNLLNRGASLAEALEQVPGVLHEDEILAIRFDAQSGTVTTAVRENVDEESSDFPERPTGFRSTITYVCTVMLLGFPVVVFIQMKIMPALNEILREYGMGTPSVTEWSWRLADAFASYGWLAILAVVVFLLSMLFASPGRLLRRAARRLFGPFRDLRSAALLRKLAIATRAGRPIAGALSTLARYHYDSAIRHKLLFVRNEMEQGADLWQSMNDVDLITSPEVRVMDLAERVGNRSWALTQLAYGKSQRATRRLEGLSQFLLPVVVLLMGLFVLIQVLAVFVPVIQIVLNMA
jgi:type II secretory pathway component PulF